MGFQNTDAALQTLLFQQELTASIVFSTMSGELYRSPKKMRTHCAPAFALVQQQVSVAAHMMPKLVRGSCMLSPRAHLH
jgi:hypothetical protein